MDDNSSFIKIGPAGSGVLTDSDRSAIFDDLEAQGIYDDMDEIYNFDKREAWDDKGRGRIAQIFIWHSKTAINSIQFQYADRINGIDRLVMSDRHGAGNGTKFDVVKLSHQTEYITWIGGRTFNGLLSSITFGTNQGQYGPFGLRSDKGEEYNFQLGEGNKFGGFYGAVNKSMVTAIGFYMKLNN